MMSPVMKLNPRRLLWMAVIPAVAIVLAIAYLSS
jgi:hypothetical protein